MHALRPFRYWLAAILLMVCALPTPVIAADLAKLEEDAFRDAVAKVAPAVVRIEVIGPLDATGGVRLGAGPSSGLLVSNEGHIVTSGAAFSSPATSVLVTFANGQRASAVRVATDHSRNLVLLKASLPAGATLPTAVDLAEVPTTEMKPGSWTVAIGRSYEIDSPNISVGILSATGRIWGKAIQTDAKISPANYGGPLVDIHGRVLGILTPLSMQANEEMSGSDWYDSGIGFAVPFEHIRKILPRLIAGEDLHKGLMGIRIGSRDLFTTEPVVAACPPGSPAFEAGIRPDDKIVAISGQPVINQAQLKHQIGPLYAGESATLSVMRGETRHDFELTLAQEIAAYDGPFLGILTMRDDTKNGLLLRYVYPDSPAADAGLRSGDRITSLGGKPVKSLADARGVFRRFAPESPVAISYERTSTQHEATATLTRLPEVLPGELPSARAVADSATEEAATEETDGEGDEEDTSTGTIDIKLPEFKNTCKAFVPASYDAEIPHGVVVWLSPPARVDSEAVVRRWKTACETHDLILLIPEPRSQDRWHRDEIEFVRKALNQLVRSHTIDRNRIVAAGQGSGGSMAHLITLASGGAVRAVVAINAPLPLGAKIPSNNPVFPVSVYIAIGSDSSLAERVAADVAKFREAKYPVVEQSLDGRRSRLNAEELSALARWIDTLDRL